MPLSNRMACPSMSTRSMLGITLMILLILSGVRDRDTRLAILSPTLMSRSFRADPILAIFPMSMPPEPVTGFCCLPRSATMDRIFCPIFSTSPPASSSICVKLAESTFSAMTSSRISLSYTVDMSLLIFCAVCGRAPTGSITRCEPYLQPIAIKPPLMGVIEMGTRRNRRIPG